MSLEEWKTGLDWAAIILTGLTVFSGAAALIVGNRLNDIKDAQLRKFSKDLTDTRRDVATQQIRAAEAERKLLELQERVKPRRLTDDQRAAFVSILKGLPHGVVKVGHTVGGSDEALHLAQQILPLFKQAGWVAPAAAGMSYRLDIQVTGVGVMVRHKPSQQTPAGQVFLTPVLLTLQQAFRAVGMDLQFIDYHPEDDDIPEVIIGSKPELSPVQSP